MNKFISILFYALTPFLVLGQIDNNKDEAYSIGNTNNWNSDQAKFVTSELHHEQPTGTCYDKPFTYGKWFKFLATSNTIEAKVKIGNGYGTMTFPYIYLYNEALETLTCKAYLDDTTDISLNSSELVVGSWYYVAVYNHNLSKYTGSFSLFLNNQISNDFKAGAYEVFEPENWCSDYGEFSTEKGSPDEKKPSCLNNGPNFNQWFKFNAVSNKASIEVKYGNTYGTAQFPYISLWDENMNEIGCDKYTDDHQETKIETDNLIVGKDYFIAVDHQYNDNYKGSFTLCIDNQPTHDNEVVIKTIDLNNTEVETIVGKIMYKTSFKPVQGKKIILFENSVKTQTTTSDPNGRFVFNNIAPNKNFMIVIEEQGPDLLFEIYQTNNKGEVVKQVVKHNKSAFGFEQLSASCNKIVLLDCNRSFDLNISPGKIGMIGKVVNKQDPTNSLNNISVYLYDNNKSILDSTKTNKNGDFNFVNLVAEDDYMIKLGIDLNQVLAEMLVINDQGNAISSSSSKNAGADGFFSFSKLPYILAEPLKTLNFEDVDIELSESLSTGKSIVLNNIYFNPGKSTLLEISYNELDKLVNLMNKNKSLKIEIGGHTDNFGTDEMNLTLSNERALAVKQYLISKGISNSRLFHKGYGSTKPIGSNETEAGRKQNRRVEFIIL